MRFLTYIAIFIFFLFPLAGNAQVVYFDDFKVIITPKNPGPEEQVTLKASDASFSAYQSYFTWYVSGVLVEQGLGEDKIILNSGKANQQKVVRVTINTNNNTFIEEQLVIQPVEVTVLWQADTIVPPIYKGKPLYSPASDVTFIALPNVFQNGVRVPSKNLLYTWSDNQRVLGHLSGVGKDTITLNKGVILRNFVLSVQVETTDRLLSGSRSIVVPITDPEIVLYENDPLIGVKYEKAIGDEVSFAKDEVSIQATSFFFSPGDVSYSWNIDRKTINNNKNTIVLRSPGGESAFSSISTKITHPNFFLQSARNTFRIKFNTPLLENFFTF